MRDMKIHEEDHAFRVRGQALMALMVKSVGQRGRRVTDCSLTLKFWGLSDTAAL